MSLKHLGVITLSVAVTFLLPVLGGAKSEKLPPGTYLTTITEADIPPTLPPRFIPVLVGQWEIEFTEAGNFITSKNGGVVVEGRYISGPSQVVITDSSGPLACLFPGGATGVYEWMFDNNQLTLKVIQDQCAPKVVVVTAHPLLKE